MRIVFTVTNDLIYDQRMHRICKTLAETGHEVLLVGRTLPQSLVLTEKAFAQKRLPCRFRKGFLFYAEYNLRLCWFLLFARYDAVCSIDLDTLPAGCFASLLRRKKRVFDAHEYFTEVPEVVGRPLVRFFWEMVARCCLPFYQHAYTVGPALAAIFEKKYGLHFGVVRNVADVPPSRSVREERFFSPRTGEQGEASRKLLYQGALNEGRGIETLLEAMALLSAAGWEGQLLLAGEGDLSEKLRQKAAELGLASRATFLGYVQPQELKQLTAQAWLGLNLLENRGLSYYYSLANKFFDTIQAGVPVLTMDFPEYRALNAQHEVAILLPELHPESLASAIRNLSENPDLYQKLHTNCLSARNDWNWALEKTALLHIWQAVEKT